VLVAAPLQKHNDKVPVDKKGNFVNNKSNSNRENSKSFYSFNTKNSIFSTQCNPPHSSFFKSNNQYPQKPFHSNVYFNFANIRSLA
jgi:hypothetical protein